MTTTTPTQDLVEGFAQILAAASIGLTWQASGDYAPDETGIYQVRRPTDPDRVVVLAPYPLTADPTRPENETGIQFYLRTGTGLRDAWAFRDAIDDTLLGLFPVDLPTGVKVTALTWTSGTLPALDDRQRWVSIANYTARHYRPSAHRN